MIKILQWLWWGHVHDWHVVGKHHYRDTSFSETGVAMTFVYYKCSVCSECITDTIDGHHPCES